MHPVLLLVITAVVTLTTTTNAFVVYPSVSKHCVFDKSSLIQLLSSHKSIYDKNLQYLQQRSCWWNEPKQHLSFGAIVTAFIMLSFIAPSPGLCSSIPVIDNVQQKELNVQFSNGGVVLANPLPFKLFSSTGRIRLQYPRFLGSGGGGAVFAFTPTKYGKSSGLEAEEEMVIKVSWSQSTASVERECTVLQVLEKNHVQGVELCLGMERYPNDSHRVMIAMKPVVLGNSIASIDQINAKLQPHAVRCIIRTFVQMLAAGVVTTDVQPLISETTGDVLFIDLTEAKILSSQHNQPLPFLDVALASSFCAEMLALVPEQFYDLASTVLLQELRAVESRGDYLAHEIYDLLLSQTPFISRECLDYIDTRL